MRRIYSQHHEFDAGLCGLALGAVLALKGKSTPSVLKSSLISATSLSILSLSFSGMSDATVYSLLYWYFQSCMHVGAQEYTRALTCSDTPVNSAVGGAAAGALLFMAQGGNPVLGAGIVAAMGCSIDMLFRQLGASNESRAGQEAFFSVDRIFRKTTDEEREAFLEKRKRRIRRMDVDQHHSSMDDSSSVND